MVEWNLINIMFSQAKLALTWMDTAAAAEYGQSVTYLDTPETRCPSATLQFFSYPIYFISVRGKGRRQGAPQDHILRHGLIV